MSSLKNIAANNYLVFRSQTNDVSKRMGDLRTLPQTDGAWARAIAGQSEYKSIHNTYQTLQIGGDKRIGNFYVGGTASYTDGDGKLDNGSTDDKNWSFGLYGGWIADDGQYIDIIVKRHHTESDYDLHYTNGEKTNGSMDTSGTSVAIEYGWRLGIANTNYYIEPQAELIYGHLNSTGYTTSNGVRISQDAIKAAVGRAGIAAGWVSPEKTGSAYIKASVLHDWEGEAEIQATKGNNRRSYTEDMGGTWGEFALGGTWNINKNLAAYGEVETTAGNPVRTTYQVSGGIRYSF
ncbi:autotransporter outer membrane beta-barrel domain-containing protein [Oxalobacter aliiformigenes]|nr:autotransporter outer membrane beta-barrel domain-containing protein [Oxalobacter aliiformigenes]WAW00243.1 autotransporter outer membrane beta-barrel domain-containing protein [Oxalobacter aliiformigenes]